MLRLLVTLIAWAATEGPILEGKVKLEPPPQSEGLFVQSPLAVDWDHLGRAYVLDAGAQTVWVWTARGRYHTRLGKAGQGPGEFSFSKGLKAHRPAIRVQGQEVWVYDDGPHQMNVFDLSGAYLRSLSPTLSGGHPQTIVPHESGKFLVLGQTSDVRPPDYFVGLIQGDGSLESLLQLKMPPGPNRTDHFLMGYEHQAVLFHDPERGMVLAGTGQFPHFEVWTKDHGLQKVAFSTVQRELIEADKAEFREYEAASYDHGHPLVFPDRIPYYNLLMTLGDEDFLVASISPYYRKVSGLWLAKSGRVKRNMSWTLGEGGALLGSRGSLLMVTTDDAGEFQLSAMRPKSP